MLREWRLVREQAASLQKNDGGRGWVSMVEFDGRISIDNLTDNAYNLFSMGVFPFNPGPALRLRQRLRHRFAHFQ